MYICRSQIRFSGHTYFVSITLKSDLKYFKFALPNEKLDNDMVKIRASQSFFWPVRSAGSSLIGLGELSPIGRLFTMGRFWEIPEVAHICVLLSLISTNYVHTNFDKKMFEIVY
jgi:hypothetical protein